MLTGYKALTPGRGLACDLPSSLEQSGDNAAPLPSLSLKEDWQVPLLHSGISIKIWLCKNMAMLFEKPRWAKRKGNGGEEVRDCLERLGSPCPE